VVPAARRSIGPALSYPALCCVLLLVALGMAPESASTPALGVNGLLLLGITVISTAAHEAGHAFVARAVGLVVVSVYIGRGRAVWRRKVGVTQLVLQLVRRREAEASGPHLQPARRDPVRAWCAFSSRCTQNMLARS